MALLKRLEDAWTRLRLWRLRRAGLTIGDDCRIDGMPSFGSEPYLITIGKHVAISGEVVFITHDGGTHLFREQERFRRVLKYGRITVHDNCFIGYRATILPGVAIGPNSIVAAGSVVTRSVPPGVVVLGHPAKPIMRVSEYAEWALAMTPPYDVDAYRRDKRAVLRGMRLRGDRSARAQHGAADATATSAVPRDPAASAVEAPSPPADPSPPPQAVAAAKTGG